MGLTLNQLKAQQNNNTNEGAAKEVKPTTVLGKTKSVAKKTMSGVKAIAPVTNRRFEDIVSALNNKHNDLEREDFRNKTKIHMIADAVGVNLPTDDELDEHYEILKEIEEKEAAEQAAKEEAIEVVENEEGVFVPADMMAQFQNMMNKLEGVLAGEPVEELLQTDEDLEEYMTAEPVVEEVIEEVVEVEEEPVDKLAMAHQLMLEAQRLMEEAETEEQAAVTTEVEPEPVVEEQPEKPKQRRFKCAEKGCRKKVYEKGDICDAHEEVEEQPEEVIEEEVQEGTSRRKRLGRQKPFAETDEVAE